MMRRMAHAVATAALVTLLAPAAGALTIAFDPSAPAAAVGDSFEVDVRVSDLGGEVVRAYDLDILFDDGILQLDGVDFAGTLGDPSVPEVFLGGSLTGGVLDIAAVSLLPDAGLDALQDDAGFRLATLRFTALADGTSELGFDFDGTNEIVGGSGQLLVVTPIAGRAQVGATPVPEPGAALAFAVGLAAVGWRSRRRHLAP